MRIATSAGQNLEALFADLVQESLHEKATEEMQGVVVPTGNAASQGAAPAGFEWGETF